MPDPTPAMDPVMNMDTLTINIITVVSALVAVIVVFIVAGLILRSVINSLARLPALKRIEPGINVLRRNLRLLLLLVCVLTCFGVAGYSGYLLYRGEVLWSYTLDRLREVPREYWVWLAIAVAKVLGLIIVTAVALRPIRAALRALSRRAQAYDGIKANDESVEQFFRALERIARRAAWLYVLVLATKILAFPEIVYDYALVLLKIYLIVAAGLLLWRALDAIIDSLDALSKKYSSPDNILRYYDRLEHLVPLFRRCVEAVVYVLMAWAIVSQVQLVATLADWGPKLIRVIAIIFLARLLIELLSLIIEELLITRATLTGDQRQRRMTIVPLIQSITRYVVYFAAGIEILKQLGQDPTPILAGAGILGLAVGLGAQNLINDMVSGFFILFDGYFLVGDFIKTGDAEGTVEAITLRATRVRDNEGRVHIVRNGEIEDLVNYSKEFTRAIVEVGVAYESNLDEVFAALRDVGEQLARESDMALEPTQIMGLDNFGESELTIRTGTKVKPGCHLPVARAVRKLIKEKFDAVGIEIPYARRVLILQDADGNEVDPASLSTA